MDKVNAMEDASSGAKEIQSEYSERLLNSGFSEEELAGIEWLPDLGCMRSSLKMIPTGTIEGIEAQIYAISKWLSSAPVDHAYHDSSIDTLHGALGTIKTIEDAPDLITGRKIRKAVGAGGKTTKDNARTRNVSLVNDYYAVQGERSKLKKSQIAKIVGKRYGVSARTVLRAVKRESET